MGLVVTQFTNPWGASSGDSTATQFQPARPDLWQLDMQSVATVMPGYLDAAWSKEAAGVNNPAMYSLVKQALPARELATFLARSVTLPKRILQQGQVVRRDNGAFESPGYSPNVGRVEVVFVHELSQNYQASAIWALLTVWRALARSGMGPDFPGSPDLTFGLLAAASTGLLSPYRQDFSVTLLSPSLDDNGANLVAGPGYVVKNAWPAEFGLEQLNYENGRNVLELRASFQCDDVLPDSALNLSVPTSSLNLGNVTLNPGLT